MNQLLLAILSMTSLTPFASAQTPSVLLDQSRLDYRAADTRYKAKINNPDSPPCDILVAKFERNYADWYQQNAGQVETLYRNLDDVTRYINAKIAQLRSASFRPVIDKGQKQDSKVTFQTAVDYVLTLSHRKKIAIRSKQLEAFKLLVTDAESSPSHLSLDQVVASLKNMSQLMNASLKEQGATFDLFFKEVTDGYVLKLVISLNGIAKSAELDLLSPQSRLDLNTSAHWALLSESTVGNYPVDALLRYRQMVTEAGLKSCLPIALGSHAGLPYVSIRNFKQVARKPGPLSTVADLVSGPQIKCTLGTTGSVLIEASDATILSWGMTRRPSWGTHPIELSDRKIVFLWQNEYSKIWIADGKDGLTSSHGEVHCEYAD